METAIIKIGNLKGLRLSKTILEKYNVKDKVEMILEKEQIILRPPSRIAIGIKCLCRPARYSCEVRTGSL